MNDMTVGMENLPNVFIDKIDLYPMRRPSSTYLSRYRIQVKLCMYDYSPKRSWYGRESLSGLSIKMVFRGGSAAAALNDGSESLHGYNPDLSGVVVINQSDFSIETEMASYTKFSAIIEVQLPTMDSLNVYAACFIDGLEFGNDLFNKFYGPMTAEKIFVGGVVNEESGYFYHPDTNEEYGGPVHVHQGTYMEGSIHSMNPHETLVFVSEEDYKIRNFSTSFDLSQPTATTFFDEQPDISDDEERKKLEESIASIEEKIDNKNSADSDTTDSLMPNNPEEAY